MPDNSRRRWRHHGILAALSLFSTGLTVQFGSTGNVLDGISLATAYLCLVFMAIALSVGPLRAVRSRPLVLNIYLRRDVGIWAALVGLVHLFVATELSMSQDYMAAYVNLSTSGLSGEMRAGLFSWGSIAGFVVGLLVLLLLVLSNNWIMRTMGSKWWKRLQRCAYVAFILTVMHGFAFQALEARNILLIGVVAAVFAGVLIVQLSGFRAVKKDSDR